MLIALNVYFIIGLLHVLLTWHLAYNTNVGSAKDRNYIKKNIAFAMLALTLLWPGIYIRLALGMKK